MDTVKRQINRNPVAGACVSIDGESWHKNGQACHNCGFGIDDFGDGKGFWSETLIDLKELSKISHRDFETKYLGKDTREKLN